MKRLNETKNLSKMSDKDQSLDSFSFEKFEERKTIVFNKKKPGFLKLSLDAITSLSNDEDNNSNWDYFNRDLQSKFNKDIGEVKDYFSNNF